MSDKVLKEVAQEELSDVVELVDDTGRTLKFYHIGTMDYKDEGYVFFQPAEEIEGTEEDDVIIFRIGGTEGNEVLLPIEDEALLDEVYEEFCRMMDEDDEALSVDDEALYCDGNCSSCGEEGCEDREEEEK
ncbi:MAG: DUF1292 domain-containing protein [Clostridia bacterium]|nr:DUF1292 domain-containing protein [Clostridia bacterium]MBP5193715.1 DUF1292 domain-containing protein [Clostridia bacterium]